MMSRKIINLVMKFFTLSITGSLLIPMVVVAFDYLNGSYSSDKWELPTVMMWVRIMKESIAVWLLGYELTVICLFISIVKNVFRCSSVADLWNQLFDLHFGWIFDCLHNSDIHVILFVRQLLYLGVFWRYPRSYFIFGWWMVSLRELGRRDQGRELMRRTISNKINDNHITSSTKRQLESADLDFQPRIAHFNPHLDLSILHNSSHLKMNAVHF